jgi:hypothetical protein
LEIKENVSLLDRGKGTKKRVRNKLKSEKKKKKKNLHSTLKLSLEPIHQHHR